MTGKTAFVTGGTGFIGLNLIEELCAQGYSVTALHRPGSTLRFLSRFDVRHTVGSIVDHVSVDAAMQEGVDVVFHAAANTSVWSGNNAEQTRDNVEGTRNVVEVALAKGARRIVHTSSCTVFGLGEGPFNEDSPLLGRESWINYVRTKSLADDLVRAAAARGLSTVVMRPAHVLGRYDTGNWATLIRLAVHGKLPGVPAGSGCFCNGREVARAHVRAADRGRDNDVFVLGGPVAGMRELATIIADVTQHVISVRTIPDVLLRVSATVFGLVSALTGKEPRLTPEGVAIATHDLRVDDRKARRELDYAHVPLRQSVRESFEFLRQEGLL